MKDSNEPKPHDSIVRSSRAGEAVDETLLLAVGANSK